MPGTLGTLILRGLTWGPRHGYSVARWIEQNSGDTLVVLDGALYTALHRMEERDLVASEWGLSPTGRRAKFYRLTPTGRARLKEDAKGWNDYVAAVARVMATRAQPA
jgi:PadR family transcriptional regulator, regulatory protein PadR